MTDMRNRYPATVSVVAACTVALAVCALASRGASMTRFDVDADGQPEIILENEYLRVEIMTGEEPSRRRSISDALLRRPEGRRKYGTRFVWAGWIHNITFKPTRQRWFANVPGHHWHGIPEEFEQAVKMREVEPGVFDVLKVGIGVCRGTGICHSGSLKLQEPAPWTVESGRTPAGGQSLVFSQEVDAGYGYAYRYEKRFTLEPRTAHMSVSRRLTNTGRQPIRTTWYTHAFWAQAAAGDGLDTDCWSTIPVRYSGDGPLAGFVDTASCMLSVPEPFGIWGPVAGEAIPESWYACGNRKTHDVVLTTLDLPLAWDRIWTAPATYSCEPFVVLNVAPGATQEWTVQRTFGVGLDAVRGGGAAGLLNWSFASESEGSGKSSLLVEFLPAEMHQGLELRVELAPTDADAAGKAQQFSFRVGQCGPTRVVRGQTPAAIAAGLYRVRATVRDGQDVLADVTRLTGAGVRMPNPRIRSEAFPASALILTEVTPADKDTPARPSRPGLYLKDAVGRAGFQCTLADPSRRKAPDPVWGLSRVCIIAGLPGLPGYLRGWLETFVAKGNGLVFCGPLHSSPFEFSGLLPIRRVIGDVNVTGWRTRDGTDEFVGASARRYHLRSATDHPILRELPFFPEVHQDIARLQVVEPSADATVLLTYATGEGLTPPVTSPALLVKTFGKGRAAVFASPVDWGLPPSWVVYCRLGEYHRKLFAQTALWAAGLLPE